MTQAKSEKMVFREIDGGADGDRILRENIEK